MSLIYSAPVASGRPRVEQVLDRLRVVLSRSGLGGRFILCPGASCTGREGKDEEKARHKTQENDRGVMLGQGVVGYTHHDINLRFINAIGNFM